MYFNFIQWSVSDHFYNQTTFEWKFLSIRFNFDVLTKLRHI